MITLPDPSFRHLTCAGAIIAPCLHSLTDLLEYLQGGFSELQLWMNYAAFLPMPAIVIGLYALQRPKIATFGLLGALLYGFAFIYFAHTSLFALTEDIPTYAQLWNRLGMFYSFNGGVMIAGGVVFAIASLQARVLPRWTVAIFLVGLVLHLVVALIQVPEIVHTLASGVRNAGLFSMGIMAYRIKKP